MPSSGRSVRPKFQFPPPRGGEQIKRKISAEISISIPAPARGRTLNHPLCSYRSRFQFPPPRGGEQRKCFGFVYYQYFNSRPREGANIGFQAQGDSARNISIPAPARGRTFDTTFLALAFQISIPAPARGRTSTERLTCYGMEISIPAPARGRTPSGAWCSWGSSDFNSRPREGANSKTAQNRAVYLVSLLKFGRISAILPYILSATRAKKRETPKIIGFLLRRPTGRSCTEQVGAGGVR